MIIGSLLAYFYCCFSAWSMLNEENKKELEALVSLLDEPNEDMFSQIRHKVLTYGEEAIPALEEAWANYLGDNETDRIEALINEIRVNELQINLSDWIDAGSKNLFRGYLLLMHYLVRGFDEEKFLRSFDRLVKEVWLEMNDELTALEKVKVLNHIFYIVHGFKNIDIPPITLNDYLCNTLIDKKKGNSLTLGILYISVSQALEIPVFGVDLPGNFISVYMDDNSPIRETDKYVGDDVLFYLNPANMGNVFTHNEVKYYCGHMNLKLLPEYFMPSGNKIILIRLMSELESVFRENNNDEKADGLLKVISVLNKK